MDLKMHGLDLHFYLVHCGSYHATQPLPVILPHGVASEDFSSSTTTISTVDGTEEGVSWVVWGWILP